MTAHPDILELDILDQPEPLRKWLAGSLILHALLIASLLGFNVIGHQTMQLGDPHGGGIGSVQINPVASIPLPSRSGPSNPVASATESKVPTPPPAKAKPAPKVKAPDPNAIALQSRLANQKPTPAHAEPNKFAAARKDLPNQNYSSVPQAVSNPMYQMRAVAASGSATTRRSALCTASTPTACATRWRVTGKPATFLPRSEPRRLRR